MFFVNLTIMVEEEYPSLTGYLLGNFSSSNSLINIIENCHVICNFSTSIITPGLTGDWYVNGIIRLCSFDYISGSTPPVFKTGTAGICGSFCGTSNIDSNVFISFCYSTGIIGNKNSGGICGLYAGRSNSSGISNVNVTGCYSTGDISGTSAGGICGSNAGLSRGTNTGLVNITSCYSTGTVSGSSAGGICGDLCGSAEIGATSIINVIGCYSVKVAGSMEVYSELDVHLGMVL